jgi:hypothetical protein
MNAHAVAKGSQPFIFSSSPNCQGVPGVIREQSRESSLLEREETVNSTRSCLCVHFQKKVQETALLQPGIAFRGSCVPRDSLKAFRKRKRGLIDNRLVLELEA